ncbi:MAG: NAD(P)-dependent oxidoreductase [Liquorilactobacillus ghanensis]|uniref:NAD(P)-dependent oxidoreductase n=1 Tax=Liquorilactobacillus ghanensis TaxID=399370 RepID=UPI0039ECD324
MITENNRGDILKVVITDTEEPMDRDLDFEKKLIRNQLGINTKIVTYVYHGNREELIDVIHDADGILTSYLNFDAELLEKCSHLKTISIEATGYNNINLQAATNLNIGVSVIQEYCTEEVSDFVVFSMMAMNKQLKYFINQSDVKRLYTFKIGKSIQRLSDSTLGIMGLGKIGCEVARKAAAFGIKVITYSTPRAQKRAEKLGIKMVDKQTLFKESDFIALTMRLTKDNIHILNEKAFEQMLKKPIIVNIARGQMIDEKALIKALNQGKVRGAVLDVLTDESPHGLQNNPLIGRDDVIITPHIAFYSDQSLEDCQRIATENLINYLSGNYKKMFRLVNTEVL